MMTNRGGCRVTAETDHAAAGGSPNGAAGQPGLEDAAQPSVGELVREASEQISLLIRAEFELAKAELSATAKRAGVGTGLISAAAVTLLLSLPFLFVAAAEVLVAVGLPRWSAYLIVWGLFVIAAALLALIGVRLMRRLRKPERTIEAVKETARWARHPTDSGSATAEQPPHAE
jgi:Putative Actinobacterial Holin-X, holin superfamily III